MKILRHTICLITFVICFLSFSFDRISVATDLKEALEIISDFADKMCGEEPPLEGRSGSAKLSGKLEAELSGLFKKLANIGIEGAGTIQKTEFEGLLRKDLPEMLKDRRNCNIKILKILKSIIPGISDGGPPDLLIVPTSPVGQAVSNLSANKNGSYDLHTRMAAIYELQSIGIQSAEIGIKKMIINELQRYIRNNVMHRKVPGGEGIEVDRGTFKPADIIAAINALREIRRSTGVELKIDLSGINFNRINLGHLDMEGFYLAYSTFQFAFLGPKLRDTIFNFADLSYAAIWNADMTNASFIKAILRGTKFANVQLGGSNIEQAADRSVEVFHDVKGLTKEQVVQFPRSD